MKSSCIIFPIEITCIDTNWLNKSYGSAENVYIETSAWAKGWAKQDFYSYDNYIINFNWLTNYFKTHFYEHIFLKIIFPYCLLIFLFFYFNKEKAMIKKSKINNIIKEDYYFFVLIVTILSVFFWFFSSPDIRYGYSQLILFFSLSLYWIVYKFNLKIDQIIKIIFKILLFQCILRIIIYNFDVNSRNLYKEDYFPNIPTISIKKINGLNIPIDNLCWDVEFPCVTKESQIDNIESGYYYNYLFYKSLK